MTRHRILRPVLAAIGLVIVLALLHPWRVVPLNVAASDGADPGASSSAPRADDLWNNKVMHAATLPVPKAGAQASFLAGTGTVRKVDKSSQVGLAVVAIAAPGTPDIVLQIGPVLRGTAIRDALGLKFSDFDSQIDYARIADALNAKALAALGAARPSAWVGKTITFAGAGTRRPDGVVEIVPVRIEVGP